MNHLDNYHDKLMQSFPRYKSWHEGDEHHIKNWALFGVIVFATFSLVSGKIQKNELGLGLISSQPSFLAAAPTNGLAGFWKFDEGSGSTAQNSVSGGLCDKSFMMQKFSFCWTISTPTSLLTSA